MVSTQDIRDVWESKFDICSLGYEKLEKCEEFIFCSSLGEDVILTLHHDDSPEGITEAMTQIAIDFDAEEHAVERYKDRFRYNVQSIPNSLKALLEDAEAIGDTLVKASDNARSLLESCVMPSHWEITTCHHIKDRVEELRRCYNSLSREFRESVEREFEIQNQFLIVLRQLDIVADDIVHIVEERRKK